MANILQVPEFYPTLQSAHDAAHDGDMILLKPGVYPILTVTKPVHIFADTPDPANEQVVIGDGDSGSSALRYETSGGPLYIEGVRCRVRGTSINIGPITGDLDLYMNRCLLAIDTYAFGAGIAGTYGNTHNLALRVENCTIDRRYTFEGCTTDDVVDFVKSQLNHDPNASDASRMPTIGLTDYTITPSTGYGWEYGYSYFEQALGPTYSIAGVDTLNAGDSPELTEVLAYRETAYMSDQMELAAYRRTNPDPSTGAWRLDFLPRQNIYGDPQRYAIAINPPSCYRGDLLRWYEPQPN